VDITIAKESWALKKPFRFAGYTIASSDVVTVTLKRGVNSGHGEATGVIYHGETPDSIVQQLASLRGTDDLTRARLLHLLPPGGARNAIDCALWDLECKEGGETIWQKLGTNPSPILTVNTIGLEPIETAKEQAIAFAEYPLLKVKLDEADPVGRIAAIRSVRPDARLVVDANQSWTIDLLRTSAQPLADLGVEMIEQPLRANEDAALEGFPSPIPICADESCLVAADIEGLRSRYAAVNIKLDKCGGLTEALEMVRAAHLHRMQIMVGNMIGTSLSMAPNYVVAQFCKWVDMDGPLALVRDREHGLSYRDGWIAAPTSALWG
jgi:L-Ala-D/L-Glu epimerase